MSSLYCALTWGNGENQDDRGYGPGGSVATLEAAATDAVPCASRVAWTAWIIHVGELHIPFTPIARSAEPTRMSCVLLLLIAIAMVNASVHIKAPTTRTIPMARRRCCPQVARDCRTRRFSPLAPLSERRSPVVCATVRRRCTTDIYTRGYTRPNAFWKKAHRADLV